MSTYNEERLAELLALLPPAPMGWVQAAQELPLARRELDEIVELAVADERFRQALIADLESALTAAGYQPERRLVKALRERFQST
jgi:hypothetical protein